MSQYHIPVLLAESISALVTNPDGTYADATFGGGGHTAELLSRLNDGGRVIAFDRDIDALGNAPEDGRLTLIHNNFRYIENYAEELRRSRGENEPCPDGPAVFDGILADLGVSSHQFDTAGRGFSFRFEDAPLDMRMNGEGGMTAADIVNSYSEEELEKILRLYGEVDGARAAARLIASARNLSPISTTGDLDRALSRILPRGAEHKVLAKIYQALRIEVNQEMRALEKFLEGAARSLVPGGRLVVITYHSLEDRMVKNFMRSGNIDGSRNEDMYGRSLAPLEVISRKPIVPSESEIQNNTRARSAKLRIAERRAGL
ncbi:MAG: 16S rRNA (cytosine(1402)-N(4))-methyltransferase RsmH [Bacteroidales bacterium]|nr:16S rRNA (cytosine(1402)-N(4))-methyltransferase RsmH [Bacteroidales bacterium]MBP5373878.1 16S rRNA (cytosine(1402)-N(4))-methyltransferase RsmH [Bacteroidales bacterium]